MHAVGREMLVQDVVNNLLDLYPETSSTIPAFISFAEPHLVKTRMNTKVGNIIKNQLNFRATMEIPVHDVVNTGEETFRVGNGATGLINISLKRWKDTLEGYIWEEFVLLVWQIIPPSTMPCLKLWISLEL